MTLTPTQGVKLPEMLLGGNKGKSKAGRQLGALVHSSVLSQLLLKESRRLKGPCKLRSCTVVGVQVVLAGLLASRMDKTVRYMFRVSLVELDVDTGISTNCSVCLQHLLTVSYRSLPLSHVACSESEVSALR